MTSILDGVDAIVDNHLQLDDPTRYGSRFPKYLTRQAYLDLSSSNKVRKPTLQGCLQDMMEKIRSNSNSFLQPYNRQASDWKWNQACEVAEHSTSLEKLLEKLIIKSSQKSESSMWANQVPTCNGFEGSSPRRIDLARKIPSETDAYEFIELKFGNADQNWGSNHPLFASFEILKYGLLFLLSREKNLIKDSYDLAKAKRVELVVLAPVDWYGANEQLHSLAWLVEGINNGLRSLLLECSDLTMNFSLRGIKRDTTEELLGFLSSPPIDWEQSRWTCESVVDSWIEL